MDRVIKFRALYGGQWYYTGSDSSTWSFWGDVIFPDYFAGLNGCKVMQYTGLKDKNGVEIFEGDIVAYASKQNYLENAGEVTQWDESGSVYYDIEYACYKIHVGEHNIWDLAFAEYGIEVIGNIYENSELVKEAM